MVDERFDELLHTLCADYRVHNNLNLEARTNSNIKRGLRNDDGTGVMVGCTAVGNVLGYTIEDGERVPMPGRLIYRGYDLSDLVDGYIREQRFGFPEVAYLLLFGHLPDQEQYDMFKRLLHDFTDLPQNFTEDMILKNPSHNVMNKLGRSVLALYSCDPDPDSLSVENMMRQSIELIGPNQGNTSRPVVARLRAVIGHKLPADFLQLQPLGENKRNDSVIGKPAAEDFGRRGDQIVRGMAHLVQDFHPAHETGIEQDEIESEVVGQRGYQVRNFHMHGRTVLRVRAEMLRHRVCFGVSRTAQTAARTGLFYPGRNPSHAMRPKNQTVRLGRIKRQHTVDHPSEHGGRSGIFLSVGFDHALRPVALDLRQTGSSVRLVDID